MLYYFSYTTYAVFWGGCPWASTGCLCLAFQGQQTLFLNAVIGNSVIQWNYKMTQYGLKHYYVPLIMFMEMEIAKNPGNLAKNYYWKWHWCHWHVACWVPLSIPRFISKQWQTRGSRILTVFWRLLAIFTVTLQCMCIQHSAKQDILFTDLLVFQFIASDSCCQWSGENKLRTK